jgi:hypothetical protein
VSPGSFTLTHAYAAEHTDAFDVTGGADGVVMTHLGTSVSVLGIASSVGITQSPPFPLYRFPLAVGRTWSGHWEDENGNAAADYACAVLDRTVLTIGGQPVRVWMVDASLHLLGPRTQGTADVRTWYAPRLMQTVQEVWTRA